MISAETIRCSYVDLGKPVEVGNYQWRGILFRVSEDMIQEAAKYGDDRAWDFKPYSVGSQIAFYEAVGRA